MSPFRPMLSGILLLFSLQIGCGSTEPYSYIASNSRPPWHSPNGGFLNTNPAYSPPRTWDRVRFIIKRIWVTTFHSRSADFPIVHTDATALGNNHTEPTVTWVGHSTLLIQLDGINILTDPQWSDRASPVSFAGPRRVMPPGVRFADLPPIQVVLIS